MLVLIPMLTPILFPIPLLLLLPPLHPRILLPLLLLLHLLIHQAIFPRRYRLLNQVLRLLLDRRRIYLVNKNKKQNETAKLIYSAAMFHCHLLLSFFLCSTFFLFYLCVCACLRVYMYFLAIKVMRLPSPSFKLTPSLSWRLDEPNLLSSLSSPNSSSSSSSISSSYSIPSLHPVLSVPTSIGVCYLGETFRALVSVAHQGYVSLSSVGTKIELQTATKKVTLIDSTPQGLNFSLDTATTKDVIIAQNLQELGVHW